MTHCICHERGNRFNAVPGSTPNTFTPVVIAHLNRYRVSRTNFGGLEAQVKKLKTELTTLNTAANLLSDMLLLRKGECES
jgi:hypothetical protein